MGGGTESTARSCRLVPEACEHQVNAFDSCPVLNCLTSNFLNALGEAQGTLDPSAIEVHKGIVNRAEEEVTAFLRLQDKSGVQDACQLIWRGEFPASAAKSPA